MGRRYVEKVPQAVRQTAHRMDCGDDAKGDEEVDKYTYEVCAL